MTIESNKQQVSFFYELVKNLLKIPEIRKLSELPWSKKNNMLVRIPLYSIYSNWWSKRKSKGKEETNKEKKKR